jgi:hypothetical protein
VGEAGASASASAIGSIPIAYARNGCPHNFGVSALTK